MTPTTFALYSLLLTGDGQTATQDWIVPGGLTLKECTTQLEALVPSAEVLDLGFGLEAVDKVYGCEMEPLNDRESALAVRKMLEAAAREDLRP
jgi:hypothetical protein